MSNKYEKMLNEEWQKLHEESKPLPNIMLLGETGCGKSSLINRVFGKKMAKVSDVSRGTDGFKKYEGKKYGIGANLIDSRGYELSDGETDTFKTYIKSVEKQMEQSRTADPFDKIHIIWYCISLTGGVFQDYDKKIIETLLANDELKERVCVVLTKCDKDTKDRSISKKLKETIEEKLNTPIEIFCISSRADLPPEVEDLLDMEKLIEWSGEQVDDDDMKEAFIQSQIVSLKSKRDQAGITIALYSTAAAGVAAAPIPIADAAILTSLQIAMTTQIINSYGFGSIEGLVKNVVGAVIIPALGKNLANFLVGIVPILGNVVNAAVASTFTAALGCAVSQICFVCCEKIAKGETVDFEQEFSAKELMASSNSFLDIIKKQGKNDWLSDKKPDKKKSDEIAKKYKNDNSNKKTDKK